MGGEIYQAQIVRNFFDIITGTDRNITRISMCVIAVAKLRNEAPERLTFLLDQVRKSRQNRELSIDILDYMCDVAYALDANAVRRRAATAAIPGARAAPSAAGPPRAPLKQPKPLFWGAVEFCHRPMTFVISR